MNFETEASLPSTIESSPNPDSNPDSNKIDWNEINEIIKKIYAEDDEEIQNKAKEEAVWLKNYLEEQSRINGIAIKERQNEKQEIEKETEKLKQKEEERKNKAREILERWEKEVKEQMRQNNPQLIAFRKMAKIIESGPEILEREQRYN